MYGRDRLQLRGSHHLTQEEAVLSFKKTGQVSKSPPGIIFESLLLMKTTKEILKEVLASAQTQCVLKISLKNTPNPVITAVDKVSKDQILLKPTCLYGYPLPKRKITLPEIEAVTRYKTNFNHPIFKKLRFIKNNISDIRNNFDAFRQTLGDAQSI